MNNIKTQAKAFFSKNEYKKAVSTLSQIGVEAFVVYANREVKKEKKNSWFKNAGFCNAISLDANLFSEIFNLPTADEYLHKYFNFSECLPSFEKKLAIEFPVLFIESVRTSLSFLDEDRLRFYERLDIGDDLNIHVVLWRFLKSNDEKLWQIVESKLGRLLESKIVLSDVLQDVVLWIEDSRYKDPSSSRITHYASVYSLFIKLFLNSYSLNNQSIDSEDDFQLKFAESFMKKNSSTEITVLLNALSKWIDYKDSILYPYCYDLTIKPVREDDTFFYKRSAEDYYKWELNGKRYDFNSVVYFGRGVNAVNILLEQGLIKIPKGYDGNSEQGNSLLAIKSWQTRLLLQDLKVETFQFFNNVVDVEHLLNPLLALSSNKIDRYEEGINKRKKFSSWKKAYLSLLIEFLSKGVENYPFIYISKENYLKLNNDAQQDLPKDSSREVINLFSYSVNQKHGFDRFNSDYDVWLKPFLTIGDNLFCPIAFIANNDWFYAFAQAAIENYDKRFSNSIRNDTATKMEVDLGAAFENKNKDWDVRVVTKDEANRINGDVDIVVSDNQTSLLIQLKRTKFRLNLKDAFSEFNVTDRKASFQLNNAEGSLSVDSPLLKLNSNVKKWIVSTSYENVLSDIGGCIKVNYLDLLSALKDPELISIQQLITYIEEDEGLKSLMKEFNTPLFLKGLDITRGQLGLPIALEEPKKYKQLIFSKNRSYRNDTEVYNKALDFDKNGKKRKAIKMLKYCALQTPENIEIWSALGNIYADCKEYENALKCFENALKIIPNEPFVLRNTAITLRESGNMLSCVEIYTDLSKKYWFLDLR